MPATVNSDDDDRPMRDDPDYLKIVNRTKEEISNICREQNFDPKYRDTLLLAAECPDAQGERVYCRQSR